jgi:hypothetical protein
MSAMPIQVQSDFGASIFTTLVAFVRIDDQHRHGLCCNEKGHRVGHSAPSLSRRVPADEYLVPYRLALPGIWHDESRRAARQQELFSRHVVREPVRFWAPHDDQIGMECDADCFLCAVFPADSSKLPGDI